MRYDEVYARRAARAVQQGAIDIQTFIEDLDAAGVSHDRAAQLLMQDLNEQGPIFGKFMRQLGGAAAAAVATAERQGETAGLAAEDAQLQRILGLKGTQSAVDLADAESLEAIENEMADRVDFTWVATLEKTCPRCLPLHGVNMTMSEWRAEGSHPDTIHSGWTSICHCILVPTELYPRDEVIDPLIRERVKSKTGLKGSKRTQRQVAQKDLQKSREAVKKALETTAGRRTLRLMGEVGKKEPSQ